MNSKSLLTINSGSKSKTENGIQMNFVPYDQSCRELFTRNSKSSEWAPKGSLGKVWKPTGIFPSGTGWKANLRVANIYLSTFRDCGFYLQRKPAGERKGRKTMKLEQTLNSFIPLPPRDFSADIN